MEENENGRRFWKHSETLALLECYSERKNEFQLSRRKKYAYQNLLNDLISREVLESETTTDMIVNKMKSLLRSYRNAKINEQNGVLDSNFLPYMRKMEEIFDYKPIISNFYSLNLSETPSVKLQENEEKEEEDEEEGEEEEEEEGFPLKQYSVKEDKEIISNVHSLNLSGAPTDPLHYNLENEGPIPLKRNLNKKLIQSQRIPKLKSSTKCRTDRKTIFTKKMYLKEKLKLQKLAIQKKLEYWKRKEENAQKRHEEIMTFMRSFLNKSN